MNTTIVMEHTPEVKAEQTEKLAMKESRKWTQKSLKSISRRDNKQQENRNQSEDWSVWA